MFTLRLLLPRTVLPTAISSASCATGNTTGQTWPFGADGVATWRSVQCILYHVPCVDCHGAAGADSEPELRLAGVISTDALAPQNLFLHKTADFSLRGQGGNLMFLTIIIDDGRHSTNDLSAGYVSISSSLRHTSFPVGLAISWDALAAQAHVLFWKV